MVIRHTEVLPRRLRVIVPGDPSDARHVRLLGDVPRTSQARLRARPGEHGPRVLRAPEQKSCVQEKRFCVSVNVHRRWRARPGEAHPVWDARGFG